MAYSSFSIRNVVQNFGIEIDEHSDISSRAVPASLRPEFTAQLDELAPLALSISTEKARSELIIAPVLLELWRMTEQQIGFFSGVNFEVDKAQGLDGYCDYIITQGPRQLYIESPIVMLVEAKNEDMKAGYGQCLAEMIAAQRFNGTSNNVYGVVTTGVQWKFLELQGSVARIDSEDYYLDNISKIMGILISLLQQKK